MGKFGYEAKKQIFATLINNRHYRKCEALAERQNIYAFQCNYVEKKQIKIETIQRSLIL